MSKETSQNVPVAEVQKQNEEPKTEAKPNLAELLAPPAFPVDIDSIPKEKLEMAESFGIPIGGILQWVAANQQWQSGIAALLGKLAEESSETSGFIKAVQKRAEEIETQRKQFIQPAQAAAEPGPGPGSIGGIPAWLISLIKEAGPMLSQTAAPNPLQEKFAKFMEIQIERAMNPEPSEMEKLGSAMVTAITSKVGAKTAEVIAAAIGPAVPT